MCVEKDRLRNDHDAWLQWGPYLSERAWGTVREDYSPDGSAWDYFPHDMARSRAYRWNEDGLAGICDSGQFLCFALALWNGNDPILKERLFGLSGPEGNHGEDVKECYYYLDSSPTHSYMRMLYKYPQAAFPYADLVEENRRRSRNDPEYELLDTGVFDEHRYFDVFVEYAKAAQNDILIRISAHNRGPDLAQIELLPVVWFRNQWELGYGYAKPVLCVSQEDSRAITIDHARLGTYTLHCENPDQLLFSENETNLEVAFGVANRSPYTKDSFHRYIVHGEQTAINPEPTGTKAAARYSYTIAPGSSVSIRLRLSSGSVEEPFSAFDELFSDRIRETDEYYQQLQQDAPSAEYRAIQRQALAGMLWSKQFYHFDINHWLKGDPAQPPPPTERLSGRNHNWTHLSNNHVLSMPDSWEYPWYASWDLAFHCLTLALVDVTFAKKQILLLLQTNYQHPNGQIPAYEWEFNDVNPPVLPWAAYRLYQMEEESHGAGDREFLERVFHKCLLNFTWWVNRKDSEGNNVFEGGFLGLDNIGVFDRSAPLPTGGFLEQSDATSWMGMFCLDMLNIALKLAEQNDVYEDMATKFFEHFLYIAGAMSDLSNKGIDLWDEQDSFFYDVLRFPDGQCFPLKIRSLVGLIPLFAVTAIEPAQLEMFPRFKERLEWFLQYRPDLAGLISRWYDPGSGDRRQLALVRGHRLKRLLNRALDPNEFLAPHGIRSLSKFHLENPYTLPVEGTTYTVQYAPAESNTGTFGGNSNWRGPIWFPVNYLLIEALERFHRYYSDDFLVECPTGSGQLLTLKQIASFLSQRLIGIFLQDAQGNRPVNGNRTLQQQDPHWRDLILFHEYFNGDNGSGLGASHQTGWTGLVAMLIQRLASESAVSK